MTSQACYRTRGRMSTVVFDHRRSDANLEKHQTIMRFDRGTNYLNEQTVDSRGTGDHSNRVKLAGIAMNKTRSTLMLIALLATGAANPKFVTSDPNGGWSEGGYYLHNNMWNSAKYTPCTSTLHAWSHDNWYVVTRMNNQTGDGAVKTYPNVHRDYHGTRLDSFDSLTSRFAETSPHVGIYNVAYDIWINGIARPGCTEIMIWNDNFNQVPGGRLVTEATFGDREYKVYRNARSGYIAFVAKTNFTSGTVDLRAIMKWCVDRNWFSSDSTLDQICFGVEMVSTDDKDATFRVTDFSIDEKRKLRTESPEPVSKGAMHSL